MTWPVEMLGHWVCTVSVDSAHVDYGQRELHFLQSLAKRRVSAKVTCVQNDVAGNRKV